jgi:RNA ligase (TIGR02306 family)
MKHLARIITFALKPHLNADTLSLACVEGTEWQCVVRTSDWVGSDYQIRTEYPDGFPRFEGVYISLDALLDPTVPEFSFLKPTRKFPDGRPGHRVKTVRLRGQMSQGLVVPLGNMAYLAYWVKEPRDDVRASLTEMFKDQITADTSWADLQNMYLCRALKIERYEPPISVGLQGDMIRSPGSFVHYTDIENAKNHPGWFTEGEQVRLTEKIHGTHARFGMVFGERDVADYIVGSHTTAKKLVKNGGTTLYAVMAEKHFPEAKMKELTEKYPFTEHFIVFGEIYGYKVQDLHYDCSTNERKVRIYDVVIDHVYQPWETIQKIADLFNVETVPLLYRGPFNTQVVQDLRDGKSTLSNTHVREGGVVTAEPETRVQDEDGSSYRKILKYVSDEYLCRAGEKDGH